MNRHAYERESPTPAGPPDGGWYEIGLQGQLDERWSEWFDGMTVVAGPDGTTVLRGSMVDQSALHGVLARLRDLGVPLLFVAQIDADGAPDSTTSVASVASDPADGE